MAERIIIDTDPGHDDAFAILLALGSPELEVLGLTTVGGNVPIDKKTIETGVAVQSGDTVMLGGLIQQNDSESTSGVPGLKNIPILGRLFGTTKKDNSRKELLVLITPTVIRGGGEDARELTEEYKKRFQGLSPLIEDMEAAERARREIEN